MFNCNRCGKCCRYVGRYEHMKILDRGDGTCMFLEDNLCSIYDSRPLVCNVDRMYDTFYKDKMSREEFYRLNEKACKEIEHGTD